MKWFWIDLVYRISSERKVKRSFGTSNFECFEYPLRNVLKKSLGRPLNIRLGRPLDVIWGRPQDVRSRRSRNSQLGHLGDVLRTLEGDILGTSWGPIFAGWVWESMKSIFQRLLFKSIFFRVRVQYDLKYWTAVYSSRQVLCKRKTFLRKKMLVNI